MAVIEQLALDTAQYHPVVDEDARRLLLQPSLPDYRAFLERDYGFVRPLELALLATPGLDGVIDTRRFLRHELLRRDLLAVHTTPAQISALPTCAIPTFTTLPMALGWAYVVERSTLVHATLFRRLALVMPGELAFASDYLKRHYGDCGESWRAFASAVELVAATTLDARRLTDAARLAFTARAQFDARTSTAAVARVAPPP